MCIRLPVERLPYMSQAHPHSTEPKGSLFSTPHLEPPIIQGGFWHLFLSPACGRWGPRPALFFWTKA